MSGINFARLIPYIYYHIIWNYTCVLLGAYDTAINKDILGASSRKTCSPADFIIKSLLGVRAIKPPID